MINDPKIYTDHLPGPLTPGGNMRGRLVLPFSQRQKARQRAELEDGTVVAIVLPRGTILRGGDRLGSAAGEVVEVVAALEPVSRAAGGDALLLARAAYHLGNRHVALEIGDGWLRYLHDHVLDAMLVNIGLAVTHERHAFEPEAGAYALDNGHAHAH